MENAVGNWYVKCIHIDIFGVNADDDFSLFPTDMSNDWGPTARNNAEDMIRYFEDRLFLTGLPYKMKVEKFGEFECIIEYSIQREGIGGTWHLKKM